MWVDNKFGNCNLGESVASLTKILLKKKVYASKNRNLTFLLLFICYVSNCTINLNFGRFKGRKIHLLEKPIISPVQSN